MRLMPTALAFAAAVSGIDIYLHDSGGCKSQFIFAVCTNVNPNVCCGIDNDFASFVSFQALPQGWKIDCRGHSGGQCKNTKQTERHTGPADCCLTNGPFSGGGYGFWGKKRDPSVGFTTGKCQSPDRLVVRGAELNVTSLAAEELSELWHLAERETNSAVVHTRFAELLESK